MRVGSRHSVGAVASLQEKDDRGSEQAERRGHLGPPALDRGRAHRWN